MVAGDLLGYRDRTVVVTGAASGIGLATAELLSALGADVHGIDIAPAPVRRTGAYRVLDLRDRAAIASLTNRLPERVSALFNCAGVAPGPPGIDVVTVNYIGQRLLTERLMPRIEDRGAVVNVASNGGAGWRDRLVLLQEFVELDTFDGAQHWYATQGEALGAPYSFAKEAMIVWTLALAAAVDRRGIRANAITPGAVQTPMLETIEAMVPATAIDAMTRPIGRRSSPEEQAWPLVFLGSPVASYVNGAVVPIDGGFMAARELAPPGCLKPIGRR